MNTYRLRPSSVHRSISCPGWHGAALGIPETTSEAAERGVRLHAMTAQAITDVGGSGPQAGDLESADERAIESCVDKWWEIMQTHVAALSVMTGDPIKATTETEVHLAGDDLFRDGGTADVITTYRSDDGVVHAIDIVDWKFSRSGLPDSARDQLRSYAALLHASSSSRLLSPLATYSLTAVAPMVDDVFDEELSPNQVQNFREAITVVRDKTREVEWWKHLQAGSHCRYCPAVGCPASSSQLRRIVDATSEAFSGTVLSSTPGAMPGELRPDQAAAALRLKPVVEAIWRRSRVELQRAVAEGQAPPGVTLHERPGNQSIQDIVAVHTAVREWGVSAEDLIGCATVSYSKVEKILVDKIKEEDPQTTTKDAKKIVADVLEPFSARGKSIVTIRVQGPNDSKSTELLQ